MAAIEEFCRDFGLDPEFSMHSNIRGLSGGQKVRVCVRAVATRSATHVLRAAHVLHCACSPSFCILQAWKLMAPSAELTHTPEPGWAYHMSYARPARGLQSAGTPQNPETPQQRLNFAAS